MSKRVQRTCYCPRYAFPHRFTWECDDRAQEQGFQCAEELIAHLDQVNYYPFRGLREEQNAERS